MASNAAIIVTRQPSLLAASSFLERRDPPAKRRLSDSKFPGGPNKTIFLVKCDDDQEVEFQLIAALRVKSSFCSFIWQLVHFGKLLLAVREVVR
jgi:hypothetical protein